MKHLKQIFRALLGAAALILTALIAAGRLAWRTIRNWWKKSSKWFCITFAIAISLIGIGFVSLVGYAIYKDNYGRCYWNVKQLSKNIMVYMFNDNTFRVYNRSMGKYTTPKINWVLNASQNDSLSVYAVKGKRGYINVNTGEIVINAEDNMYHKAWVFSEGLAAVMRDGKIGFINKRNEIVIPFQYDYYNKEREFGFGYLFHNGYCVMTNKKGKIGLIDISGKWVIDAVYDKISEPKRRGYRIIAKDEKYGVIDSFCNVVYPADYEYVDVFSDGFILTKGGKKWQEDFESNTVQSFMFDNTCYLNYPIGYNEGGDIQYAFAEYAKYEVMNRYGIMNRITGKPITLALYSDINMLSKDLFEVQDPESYDWYLMDTKGNVVSKTKHP